MLDADGNEWTFISPQPPVAMNAGDMKATMARLRKKFGVAIAFVGGCYYKQKAATKGGNPR